MAALPLRQVQRDSAPAWTAGSVWTYHRPCRARCAVSDFALAGSVVPAGTPWAGTREGY